MKRQVESKIMSLKRCPNKLCPASAKTIPPDMLVEEVIFPSFLCILSPFQLIPNYQPSL